MKVSMAAGQGKDHDIQQRQLQQWKLIERFQKVLDEVLAEPGRQAPATEADPRRTLHQRDYFSLFLLGLFNPVLTSMRGLCQASGLPKVQQALGVQKVSLGSFSEAQSLFDAGLMQAVFERLVADLAPQQRQQHLGGVDLNTLRVIDSTLWHVLPAMDWATWRVHYSRDSNAVRLHLKYNLADTLPVEGLVSEGALCERKALRAMVRPGEFYVGDRNYGQDYTFLEELTAQGCGLLMRLRQNRVVEHLQQALPLSDEDKEAGVTRDEWVTLGTRGLKGPFRLVVVERLGMPEPVWLVTNQGPDRLSAAQVGELYRRRWEVEGFFRWLKCLLPCRHWFAQSENGVRIQIYGALICAVLLSQKLGRRPSKRLMEMLAFHQMEAAGDEELAAALEQEVAKAGRVRKPRYGLVNNWKPKA